MNKRIVGSFYEEMAINYLTTYGFVILETNYSCKIGEIDIIAKKDDTIHCVEVKYRKNNDFGYASEAVSKSKFNKIIRCANFFINENKLYNNAISIDVIAITGDKLEFFDNCFGGM